MATTRVFVHHGGTGAASHALLHGIPQIILPTDLEKDIACSALSKAGVGLCLPPHCGPAEIHAAFQAADSDLSRRRIRPLIRGPAAMEELRKICRNR
ncbi:hypothetical protein M9979_02315 [Sphingomonas sp. RP10(2022)]|uniref:Erythromycin biosynthesis protein CIII-like C-terminal domain-containing protein n=1 Tax=Sphingomonas liriopis TaxID=2949094 RepID=A0A9X2HST7_9SPHN|nr:nucleotide disphospho-sugar-binding domain-containing protein [Sphingomonas liriopis]MCP3733716.1 hypothetical protein [Sphingomonas liriopis]